MPHGNFDIGDGERPPVQTVTPLTLGASPGRGGGLGGPAIPAVLVVCRAGWQRQGQDQAIQAVKGTVPALRPPHLGFGRLVSPVKTRRKVPTPCTCGL